MMDNIRIVLDHVSHPWNIGSVARAMHTMGLSRLYLVDPKQFPHAAAYERAAGADKLLENIQVYNHLSHAIEDCGLVMAVSARVRRLSLPILNPYTCAQICAQHATRGKPPISIVFGCERHGLSNQDLQYAHYQVVINTNQEYHSLNIAAAVQVICYELRKIALELEDTQAVIQEAQPLATAGEVSEFLEQLKKNLIRMQFLDPHQPRQLLFKLRRMFSRIQLEQVEVNILRGILSTFERHCNHK